MPPIVYEPSPETFEVILKQKITSPKVDIVVKGDAPLNNLEAIGFTRPDIAEELALSPVLLTYDSETGEYVNNTQQAGLNVPIGAQSVIAEDFDNDMDLDIYMTSAYKHSALTSVFYENQGDGTFIEVVDAAGALIVPTGPGVTFANHGMSAAAADYNLDGFLDLAIGNSGLPANAQTYLGSPHYLFENQGNDNNWLQIDLEGVVSNRDGIGAKVFVIAGDKTQLREQFLGQHFYGQNQQLLHFGLADNEVADVIRIEWPSGAIQEFENIAANQILKVVENQGTEGSDVLMGTASDDIIQAGDGKDELYGENNHDQLLGQGGSDKIYGGNGNDILEGGKSWDVLIGGKGFDDFVFQSLSEKVDRIKDFVSGVDEIKINRTGFSDLLEVGVLPDEQFVIGTASLDENDYLIYNQAKGVLFFDPDGLGDQAQIRFADLTGSPTLEASDIVIFE